MVACRSLHQRRQRHVEDRVVDPDDRDAQAQREQRQPPPLRDSVGLCHAAPMNRQFRYACVPYRAGTLLRAGLMPSGVVHM